MDHGELLFSAGDFSGQEAQQELARTLSFARSGTPGCSLANPRLFFVLSLFSLKGLVLDLILHYWMHWYWMHKSWMDCIGFIFLPGSVIAAAGTWVLFTGLRTNLVLLCVSRACANGGVSGVYIPTCMSPHSL